MIKKTDKKYAVDIRPAGRDGPRFRKSFTTRSEAIAFEKHVITKYGRIEDWQKHQNRDSRRLSDLAYTWYQLHGQHLKTGCIRLKEINNVIDLLGNPKAATFTSKDFAHARKQRLESLSANTANHDLRNFRSLYNELIRLGEWTHGNPVASIREIKIDEKELEFLNKPQINELLTALDKATESHARITARVCLATGARWGEAATLRPSQVTNGKVTFTGTKTGKNRSVPIDSALESLILDNAPLVDGVNTFKRTIKKLGWKLPTGQMTHILRHTFASHFMMNGGNIIALQRILGHATLAMTVRYSHLSPDHLTDAIKFNPISKLTTP